MRGHKPGPVFWCGTFVVGLISPGRGKRRIHARMDALHSQWVESERHNASLNEALIDRDNKLEKLTKYVVNVETERDQLGRALETALEANRQNAQAHRKNTDDSSAAQTVPLPRVTAPTIRTIKRPAWAVGTDPAKFPGLN